MRVLATTKVTRQNQTTIPKRVRDKLEVKEEDILIWFINERGEIVVKKA